MQQTSTEYNFVGPANGDYLKHDEADSTDLKFTQIVYVQWQKCIPPKKQK